MSLDEFRNRQYQINSLGFEQTEFVSAAQRWGDSAYAWMNVAEPMSMTYAIKAAHYARMAFPELRA